MSCRPYYDSRAICLTQVEGSVLEVNTTEKMQLSLNVIDVEDDTTEIAATFNPQIDLKVREVPHPIPYQGSKRSIARLILSYFPLDVDCLYEPFAGSAAVSLATSYCGLAKRHLLNDINEPLMMLWKSIIEAPDAVAADYHAIWHDQIGREREFYDQVRTRFNENHAPADFLYLLARCVKSAVRYNSRGEFNQSPDTRRKGTKPDTIKKNILDASKLLRGKTQILHQDYRDALSDCTVNDLVYMDPPYQGTSGVRDVRYMKGLSYADFVAALDELNQRNISFIVSYDGRTGDKKFGQTLPESLGLEHIELEVGRSSQATLLGRDDKTFESLYLSPALIERNRKAGTSTSVPV